MLAPLTQAAGSLRRRVAHQQEDLDEVVLQAQAKLAERETSMREVQPCQLWQAAAWHVDRVTSPLETVPRVLSQLITLAATLAAIATAPF